jgi:Flp pilus assembly protein CpaB
MSRRILLIGMTVLLAVLGTGAVLVYVRKADDRALAGKQAVDVLVAAKKVSAGTSAGDANRDGLLRVEQMPAETVPADVLGSVAELSDLVASSDIQAGQLVLRPMFVTKSERTGGLKIPAGKVAVSVALNGAKRVAGFVEIGSKVAVFDTFNEAEGYGHTPAGDGLIKQHPFVQGTRLVLTGAEVLGVGPAGAAADDTTKKAGGLAGAAADPTSDAVLVTLAVSQAEAEKLILAAEAGSVYLALVTEDSETGPSNGVDNRTLFAE